MSKQVVTVTHAVTVNWGDTKIKFERGKDTDEVAVLKHDDTVLFRGELPREVLEEITRIFS